MKVVSNSSALMALSTVGHLDIIQQKFGAISIPEAVWQETVIAGIHKPGAYEIRQADWIHVEPIKNTLLAKALQKDIDYGESEAIVLALEIEADLLLLDDKFARTIALNLGVTIMGTVGVLIWAKQAGVIPSLRDELDLLRSQANFRIGQDLMTKALQEVHEE